MKNKIILLILTFLLGILVYLSFKGWNNYLEFRRKQQEFEKRKFAWDILEKNIEQEISNFKGEAGISIKDLSTDWQIIINQEKLFPSASLVKIPIMAAYFYAVKEGRIKLDEALTLRSKHKVSGLGPLKDSPSGTKFSVEKLIEIMITESDNTATNMLIDRLGFDYLNGCFKNLGLNNTNISRIMMDFKRRSEGIENYTTACDLALLLEKIYNGMLIDRAVSFKCLELLKRQKIRDRIPAKLPLDTIVAHKTGLEKGICHDAGIVFTGRGDYLTCVLTKHSDKDSKKAKEFISQVAFLVYNYYQGF